VLQPVTKNFTAKDKELHLSSLSITYSKELKVVKPLALQDNQSSLIMLNAHQHPLSHLINLLHSKQC
jgi:hypothetical protein